MPGGVEFIGGLGRGGGDGSGRRDVDSVHGKDGRPDRGDTLGFMRSPHELQPAACECVAPVLLNAGLLGSGSAVRDANYPCPGPIPVSRALNASSKGSRYGSNSGSPPTKETSFRVPAQGSMKVGGSPVTSRTEGCSSLLRARPCCSSSRMTGASWSPGGGSWGRSAESWPGGPGWTTGNGVSPCSPWCDAQGGNNPYAEQFTQVVPVPPRSPAPPPPPAAATPDRT